MHHHHNENWLKKRLKEKKRDLKTVVEEVLAEIKRSGDDYITLIGKMNQNLIQEKTCLAKELSIQEDYQDTVQEIIAVKESEMIKLIVGGRHYATTKQTLDKVDSMLKIMVSGKYGNAIDEDGYYIIDHDDQHTLFPFILNYIRSGGLLTIPVAYFSPVLSELIDLSRYFCITELTNRLTEIMVVSDPGANVNLLTSVQSGGNTAVVYYGVSNGATPVNSNTLSGGETQSGYNNGCLIEQNHRSNPPLEDSPNRSYRSSGYIGTNWYVSSNINALGTIIIDLSVSDIPRRVNLLHAYQSYAGEGKCTHIRFSYNSRTTRTYPTVDDACWRPMHEEDWLTLTDAQPLPNSNNYSNVLAPSLEQIIEPVFTRYMKVECRNDGQYGQPAVCQLRHIKAFSRIAETNQ